MDHHRLGYGPRPSEALAFGLAGALTFLYSADQVAGLPFYLIGRTQDLEAGFCENLELSLTVASTDDPAEGWRLVAEEVARGRPALIWTNVRDLDYQHVRLENSQHAVVVVGYDLERAQVLLADHQFAELQWCGLESFARARCSSAFPGPVRHATFLVDFRARLPSAQRAAAGSIGRVIAQMRDRPPPGSGYDGGIEALRRFGEDYRRWPERYGADLARALKLLYVLIERAGTGGALFRALWAGFLEEMAGTLEDVALVDAASLYRDASELWRRFAEVVRAGARADGHRAGEALLGRIVEREARGLEALMIWHEGWAASSV